MSNIELVNRCNRAVEQGDREGLEACLAVDFSYHDQNVSRPMSRWQYVDYWIELHRGVPDLELHVADLRDGNPVSGVRQVTGTHTGALHLEPFMNAPVQATGEEIRMPREDVSWTIREHKIVKQEVQRTRGGGVTGLLEQLGVAVPQ